MTSHICATTMRTIIYVIGGCEMLNARMAEAIRRLVAHGYRPTMPRLALIEALMAQPGSVSAHELHGALRRDHPTFGQATVYRTLEVLVACGLAQAFPQGTGEVRYAYCSPQPHHHLFCAECGLVVEIATELLSGVHLELAAQRRFALREEGLTLVGTCQECCVRLGTST